MSLGSIAGQGRALSRLRNYLTSRRIPPALLFSGTPGVGKAEAARTFAKALNCEKGGDDCCDRCDSCLRADKGVDTDLHRVNAAYQAALLGEDAAKQQSIKVETVRHLIRDLEMRSVLGRWKTAVIEDAHKLVPAAANAMLKALEEPPPRTLWILVTHRPWELLSTIRSRCQRVAFSPLPGRLLAELLAGRGASGPEAQSAAALAEGSLGRALELLESPVADPAGWVSDPAAPVQMADALPRELHRSRPLVAQSLHRMVWHVRSTRGSEGYARPEVRRTLRELFGLRRALASNADPRLVLELAALRLQRLGTGRPS